MGNKRQRLACKKFKVMSGGADSQPKQNGVEAQGVDGLSSENGSEKGKLNEKKLLTRKKSKAAAAADKSSDAATQLNNDVNGPEDGGRDPEKRPDNPVGSKKPGSKHPLRIPGMKPGEGCFICKGTDHIAKLCPTKITMDRKKICLLCRKIGHTLKNCPTGFESQESRFCYNCGENGHRLVECKKPLRDGGTGFAECFVCKGRGHLSKDCRINPNGMYPNGGCCKLCNGVTHLAKDCPTKKAGGCVKLQISTAAAHWSKGGLGGTRTVFQSGDDLRDDFVSDNQAGDAIVGALNFGSDDDVPENVLQTTSMKVIPKPKMKKTEFTLNAMLDSTGPTKVHHTPKVIKFQRPK